MTAPEFGKNYYQYLNGDYYSQPLETITYDQITVPPYEETHFLQQFPHDAHLEQVFEASLTADQLYYRKNGYLILKGVISESEISAYNSLRERLALKRGSFPDGSPYVEHEAVRNIVGNPNLVSKLQELHFGNMAVMFTLTKLVSTERGWHQDSYLDDETEIPRCAVWISLGHVNPLCGPFEYVPGSHRWPALSRSRINGFLKPEFRYPQNHPNWSSLSEPFVDPLVAGELARRRAAAESFLAEPGDVLIWYGRLYHRGSPPLDPSIPRPGLIAHYSPPLDYVDSPSGRVVERDGCHYYVPRSKYRLWDAT